MNDVNADGMGSGSWLERSALCREFVAQREGILRHEWFESERAGRDIGFGQLWWDGWFITRAQWRRERRLLALGRLS